MINKLVIILGTPGAGKNVIAEHVGYCLGMTHVNYRQVMIEAAAIGNDARAQELRNSRDPFPAIQKQLNIRVNT